MKFKEHIFGGVLITLPVLYVSNKLDIRINYLEILICSVIGSLIPDIDHPKSYLGSKLHPISDLVYETFGHRTLTHSLLFVTMFYTFMLFINPNIAIGYALGILSHILLDLLTPSGVSIYYPFYKNRIKLIKKNRGN